MFAIVMMIRLTIVQRQWHYLDSDVLLVTNLTRDNGRLDSDVLLVVLV